MNIINLIIALLILFLFVVSFAFLKCGEFGFEKQLGGSVGGNIGGIGGDIGGSVMASINNINAALATS